MKITIANHGSNSVRVIKQVNVDDEELVPGASMSVEGSTLVEVRELGVGGSGSNPFPEDSPTSE